MPKLYGTADVTTTSDNVKTLYGPIFLRWLPRQN